MNSSITISLGSDTLSGFFSTEIYPIRVANKISSIVASRVREEIAQDTQDVLRNVRYFY